MARKVQGCYYHRDKRYPIFRVVSYFNWKYPFSPLREKP